METIKLTLPYPPTINHYYGNRKGGGKYIKPKGRAFREKVRYAVLMNRMGMVLLPLEMPISMSVGVYPPDNRKRDLDNVIKALQDSLQLADVYKDDCQISYLQVKRQEVLRGGRVEVKIWEFEE